MPTYALSSIVPLSAADKPAVDLNGRALPRDTWQEQGQAETGTEGAGRVRSSTVDSVTGGQALINPFSAPGSPVLRHSEWDLSTHSFVDDRGGGLVGYNECLREGERHGEGSVGGAKPAPSKSTAGYEYEGNEKGITCYVVGQHQYGSLGRRRRELETIPEADCEESSLRSRGGSTITVNSVIQRRGSPEDSALGKDSRYPAFPLPTKTITTQPLPSLVMSESFDEIKERLPPREWDTGLCSCSEHCSKCCMGLICPCVVYSQNKARCEHMRREGVQLYSEDRALCSADCAVYALLSLFCFAWPLQASNRAQIRDLFNIRGSCFGDCIASCCCSSCALAQENRELTMEERELRLTISPSETM